MSSPVSLNTAPWSALSTYLRSSPMNRTAAHVGRSLDIQMIVETTSGTLHCKEDSTAHDV
jgi:hypothetical protein